MIAKNTTIGHLQEALNIINARYGGNIKFKTLEAKGKRISFTLTVGRTSEGRGAFSKTLPGVSISPDGKKRIAAACWHVHGDFFDALFKVCPGAEVSSLGKVITKDGGNWQDWNKGSMMNPVPASKCCHCKRNIKTEKILAAQAAQR